MFLRRIACDVKVDHLSYQWLCHDDGVSCATSPHHTDLQRPLRLVVSATQ
jgi:hypothetical protein